MDFGSFSQSDPFSGAPGKEDVSAEVNDNILEVPTIFSAVDSRSKVGDASENTDIRGESNPSKNNMDIEGIMSQMHDLSFMLETNLSIPSKSNNSLLRDFVHLVSLQDFCNQVDPVHVFYCKRI
ncbi:hypothetical protein A4A49_05737 [Nicotiana attenuata]|uniref:Uncharacterized protein n=1 Tax=Nicotiana attenuata TaxID=49451 RepID=A0A314KVZ3_NICAT|nr:hypothetical protein A4A49_05737 [Nicotiana attenuata]